MNILMVLESEFPPDIRVENEAQSLIEAGHQVVVACITRRKQKEFEYFNDKIKIYRRKISLFIYKSSVGCLKFPFYFNFWRKFFTDLFQKEKFDVVHIHDLPLAKVGYEFKKKYKKPLIIDLHENWPALLRISSHTNTFLGKLLSSNSQWVNYERNMIKLSDRLIVVVEEAMERLIKAGISHEKIFVVSNTLNLSGFHLPDIVPNKDFVTLFYAGGINRHRGIQTVLSALKKVINKKSNIRLWLLGEGSYKNELIKYANKLGIQDYVSFFGWRSFNEMIELLAQSDITLIPHYKSDHTDTTIPHKLFQYMYAGKPIIASNCAPVERIIKETNTGLIYLYNDSNQLAECIHNLVNNKKIYVEMHQNGRKWVIDKYNWNIDKENLLRLYDNI